MGPVLVDVARASSALLGSGIVDAALASAHVGPGVGPAAVVAGDPGLVQFASSAEPVPIALIDARLLNSPTSLGSFSAGRAVSPLVPPPPSLRRAALLVDRRRVDVVHAQADDGAVR
eukprot:CAMPEP_0172529708 /NCGR_PEP_ID=MMETSP1067-20121228/3720_1 /TAXON_ID=265564 ORGANISM="Thalassiosira punctigera, Strain Tpunct2005C2" /NCGR_SAMPLE_ID=MMETSP1067 /ASSEMBLY_ACC=CAM_ASM_000444 /LENGTH=116 /DNA_ID=CAMNT_0013313815 /DNA_START=478 /DNA_END=826 /DNA_ORIENTATION=+